MPRLVFLHYVLRDPEGRVIDLSTSDKPMTYVEGAGQIIEGLERRLRGVAAGEKRRVVVPAAEAYGVPDPSQVQALPRESIPVEGDLQVGDRFQVGSDRGAPVLTVVKIEGDSVTLDANHPLAGVDLTFDVEIIAVREATSAEVAAAADEVDDNEIA